MKYFTFLAFLSISFLGLSQEETDSIPVVGNEQMSVAILNYPSDSAVVKYKKLELGIPISRDIKLRIDNFIYKIGYPEQRLNPFVEWDVDVEAVFKHIATGKSVKIEGFYTRDYERVVGTRRVGDKSYTDDWIDVDSIPGKSNDHPFRIRFAPTDVGAWEAEVYLKVKGELVRQFDVISFEVIDGKKPGFVKVHPNQVNLMRDDKMIFPIGHNLLSPPGAIPWGGSENYLGKNHFSANNTEKATNTKSWDFYFNRLNEFFIEGGKFIRDIQSPWMSLIEFEEKGNYFKRLHYAQEMDSLIELCEKYDGLINFNLMMHEPFMKYADYDMDKWDWGHYNEHGEQETKEWVLKYPKYCYNDKPFGQKEPHESFLDENDLNYHKQRTRYYIARYGYSTSIYEFEIMSEPFHINQFAWNSYSDFNMTSPFNQPSTEKGKEVRYAVYNYHKVLAEYMRDSLKINQLVGIDMGTGQSEEYNDYTYDSLSLTIPAVDVVGINYYYLQPNSLYINDGRSELVKANGRTYDLAGNSIASRVERIWYTHDLHAKKRIPVLVSEGGIAENYLECSNNTQFYVDMMTFPFSSIAGYNAWYGWDAGQEQMRAATIRVEEFMNNEKVLKTLGEAEGKWQQRRQLTPTDAQLRNGAKYPKELQYYISGDQNNAVGYVRNLSYNAKTVGNCQIDEFAQAAFNTLDWFDYKKGRKFKIDGLNKKKSYFIDYYSFLQEDFGKGQLIETDFQKARGGKVTLKFPTLDPWNFETGPVIWFVIREE